MDIQFKHLRFMVTDEGRIFLTSFGGMRKGANENESGRLPLSEIQLSGCNRNNTAHQIDRSGSEGRFFRYVAHEQTDEKLTIIERSERIEVVTKFITCDHSNAIAVEKSFVNISDCDQTIESAPTLIINGIGDGLDGADKTYFYRFLQSHQAECQVRKISLFDYGFFRSFAGAFKKLTFANVGSWSTNEELPQGIIENTETGDCCMFQIESNHNWRYEISVVGDDFYLALSGNASSAHRYARVLRPNERYDAARVAFCYGEGLNGAIAEMTAYRRNIAGHCAADENLPVIFNEYMYIAWDSPWAHKTKEYAKKVAQAGAEYYVIDCGWHDEMEDGVWVYPYMGRWKESRKNFPLGVRETTDYIHSLGMKAGLWIEPEIVGVKCKEMLDYYDDDCFLQRNGKRICVSDKYILDFRAKKVREYLTETIRRMSEEYGADYIKMDYNVDSGFVDGDFEEERKAYLSWVDGLRERFPNVLFETCSSGGMRMDYETLKHFSIVSTSDQIRDFLYPYIAGNVLSAVIPEQAAVWSYPVSGGGTTDVSAIERLSFSSEKVVLNMVNSMLGRLHLASKLTVLQDEQFALVQEGVAYIKDLNKIKRTAVPYFPLGFTDFSKDTVACGLKTDKKLYLAVWVLRGNQKAVVPLKGAKSAKVAYPTTLETDYRLKDEMLTVSFAQSNAARFFEIDL